jgi:alanyl-tRNA synthetase
MKSVQLRQLFLDYFKQQGHTIVPSSSLVPANDPTLLFTNAGMVQFKETFLGLEQRAYKRATSCQRCVRAGGKHNDLENVGYTARHHTFFEMLGNFSFGDYFKSEAIRFAWDFLINVLKLPPEKLWVTVYEEDKEAEEIWLKEIKVDPTRFSRCGAKDNFWSMGDTGPCGPCTEIYYDHGSEIPGGPPGSPEEEGDRYIEIWNLVFMQYDRAADGTLTPLPKPSVDTGMGFERVAAVMQGVHSNYEIDIFKNLIQAIVDLGHIKDLENKSLRVVADHIRSCAFLIADGVAPSNEGRGYVLRRIIRRAVRHGSKLGFKEPFFYQLVKPLVKEMGDAYPELSKMAPQVERILQQEEIQFARTLEQGLKILEQDIANLRGTQIPGETVFKLYDTYGFPIDLTADIAREREMTLDVAGFNEAMEAQKTRAREASKFGAIESERLQIPHATQFVGYERLTETVPVAAIYRDNNPVTELKTGETGAIVLEHSPFYAESGGQIGDQGILRHQGMVFEVQNTRKVGEAHLHIGIVKQGTLKVYDPIEAIVDKGKRVATALNHSATHLLHAALRSIIGSHVQQKGSLVEPDRLRFDFTHFEPLNSDQIRAIEYVVNEKIRENSIVETEVMPVEQAVSSGAMALFGEKYGKEVRVLKMGAGFSVELCGGTHVKRTGDIGLFKITAEIGIAAGVRRLEAVTGEKALLWMEGIEGRLNRIAVLLKSNRDSLEDKIQQLLMRSKQLEKEVQQLKTNLASGSGGVSLSEQFKEIKGIKVLAAKMPVGDAKTLREMVDKLKDKWGTAVIILGARDESGKITLIAGVTRDRTDKILAGELVNYVAKQVGGQGGGRPDMAQGGGNQAEDQPELLEKALESVYDWVSDKL